MVFWLSKKCLACDCDNTDDALFCAECGEELNRIKEDVKGVVPTLKAWWNERSMKGKGVTLCCLGILVISLVGAMASPDHNNSTTTSPTSVNDSNTSAPVSADLNSNLHDTGKMVFEEPGEGWYIKNTDEIDYVRYYRDIGKAQIDVILCYPYGDFKKTDEFEVNSLKYMEYVGKNKFNSKIEFYKSQLTSVDMYAYVVTEGDNTFIIEVSGPARDVGMKIAESIHSK